MSFNHVAFCLVPEKYEENKMQENNFFWRLVPRKRVKEKKPVSNN